jgi:hypothetical protein
MTNGCPGVTPPSARRLSRVGRNARAIPAGTPGNRHCDMTGPAEEAIIFKSALTAAVRDRHYVVRLPHGTGGPPGLPRGTIRRGGPACRPRPVRLDDVEATQPAGALVPLFHLFAHVPWAAANLPLMDAGVAAERPARRPDEAAAPPAYRFPRVVAFRLPPLIRCNDARAPGAHEGGYRPRRARSLGVARADPQAGACQRAVISESANRASVSIH